MYRDALANPPLLVVCDLDRIVVHTNFTKTVSVAHEIPLDRLGDPRSLEILRAVFFDPEKLRPGKTSVAITQEAAQHFADMAESMRKRGLDSAEVAHFLDRVVFCLFAEDIGLLPNQIFTRITEKSGGDPAKFARFIAQLFEAMAKGGEFGLETILHFNGNLFDGATVPDLTADEVTRITASARLDWSSVEPSIFGTLFERGLDPAKRSQLGAHFTGKDDIDVLVDAVVMQPLRREWDETKQIVEALLATGKKGRAAWPKPPEDGRRVEPTRPTLSHAAKKKAMGEAEAERLLAADPHRRQRVGLVRQPEPVPGVVVGQRGAFFVTQEVEVPCHRAPGYTELGHKVRAVDQFPAGHAFPDHLEHAPDAVILGP